MTDMPIQNPYLNNIERPAYEIGHLLEAMPKLSFSEKPTPEQVQMASAVTLHCENAIFTILRGLEGLGEIIWTAANNEENGVSKSHLAGVGGLIKHLAVELQFLDDYHLGLIEVLREHGHK